MKKNRTASVILTVLTVAMLAGCSGGGSQEIVMTKEQEAETKTQAEETKAEAITMPAKTESGTKTQEKQTEAAVSQAETAETSETVETDAAEEEVNDHVDLTAYHPVVNLVTDGPVESKEEYVTGTITVEGTDEKYLLTDVPVKVRIRGNASAVNTETPPYKIKFEEKNNLLGLHNGKTFKAWTLLNINSGICANYLTLHLSQAIYGENYWVSDTTLTKVYLNGTYMGLYTAAEQNQIKKNRVNVHEAVTGEEHPDDIGYLVEMDNYYETSDDPNFEMRWQGYQITDMTGYTSSFGNKHYTLKNEIVTADQLEFIDNYINNVFQLIYSATYEDKAYKFDGKYNLVEARINPEQAVRNVIDVDSAVAIYLTEELTANRDQGNGSFFMAVDFSEDAVYPKLTFTPAWDLSLVNLNYPEGFYTANFIQQKDGHETDNAWLIMLMYNDWFREEVANRLRELDQSGEIDKLFADTSVYMHSYEEDVKDLTYMNFMKDADRRIEYYTSRYNWLKSEFLK